MPGTKGLIALAGLDMAEIERLIVLFERSSLAEMTLERGQMRLILKRGPGGSVAPQVDSGPGEAGSPLQPSSAPAEEEGSNAPPQGYAVKSPIVGTFYRRPSPEMEPYVQVGDRVSPGDTLCIIEAMKVMNEVKADQAGTVTQIDCEDDQPVEYGQLLMIIAPPATPDDAQ